MIALRLHHPLNLEWHVREDDQSALQFAIFHPQIHGAVDSLHSSLHGGDLHAFIHNHVTQLHDGRHTSIDADAACGSPADFTRGGCKTAHDHLHGQLDVFHEHLQEAFGVGQ